MKPKWFKESTGGTAVGIISADEGASIALVYYPEHANAIRMTPEMVQLVNKIASLSPRYNGVVPAGALRDRLRLVAPFKELKAGQVINYINSALKNMEEEGRILAVIDKADGRQRAAIHYTMTNDKIWED